MRPVSKTAYPSVNRFQSTHPCRVRRLSIKWVATSRYFNPRTRVGCDKNSFFKSSNNFDFNPRTRVGCDNLLSLKQHINPISIHAPVWGATKLVKTFTASQLFQSTHPCGVRLYISTSYATCIISIHAPVWGATLISYIRSCPINNFNPRTRVGCDL